VETAVEALKMGAFDYIQKPFKMDHVREVLKHLVEERRFRHPWTEWPSDPRDALRRAVGSGADALVFTWDPAAPQGGDPAVRAIRFERASTAPGTVDPRELHRIKELVTMHASRAAKPVALVERVDRLVEGHEWKDLLSVLEVARDACRAKAGLLMLTLDPGKLAQKQVDDLRKLTGEPFVEEMVDVLASPIRRDVITRLESGPATFSEIMRGTGVDDSPKLTFHLKKLTSAGVLMHEGDRYALAGKGTRAAKLIGGLRTEGALEHAGPGMLFESKS
jgi:DNA-binding transcriptional ArsR family regulator